MTDRPTSIFIHEDYYSIHFSAIGTIAIQNIYITVTITAVNTNTYYTFLNILYRNIQKYMEFKFEIVPNYI